MANLIFGCGYLGERVAQLWLTGGETVFAVTRTWERAELLQAAGIRPIVADLLGTDVPQLPAEIRTVLFAVGYGRDSQQSIRDVYAGGLASALNWLPDTVERLIYVSSTGVYGQVDGQEVDEDTFCKPLREGGRACLEAELVLQASRFGLQGITLRLAGLYGPGRIPRAADLIAGRPIDAPAKGWLNLIHVDDATRIVLLAENAETPRTYVVSDGRPVLRSDYYGELARLLGAPLPRFVEPPNDSAAAMRAASDKRINPRRMFEELRPTLRYPDYQAGLAAIVQR
jgi:nucleoside-diphosphate-sugar epimerase